MIGLVGSCDLPGVALRRAQSILRWDRRPSLWSHAFIIVGDGIREVTLHSRAGHFPEPADNAITPATLEHYKDDPNVALLKVRTTPEEAQAIAERATTQPNLERLRYDLFETLGYWQAYLWTRGTSEPARDRLADGLLGAGRVLLRGDPARPHARRQRPQLGTRAPVEQRPLVERGVRRVRPPDLRPGRDPRPALPGPRPGRAS